MEKELSSKFDVKRGIRNSDGSGVLAGLTKISGVTGYTKDEKGITFVEGNLRYRGIEINSIVDEITKEYRYCGYGKYWKSLVAI